MMKIFARYSLSCLVLVFGITQFSSMATAQEWANRMFSQRKHDFGNVAANSKTEYRFEIYNPYIEEVVIDSVTSSCSCTTPIVETQRLQTYETGAVVAHFNTDRVVGQKSATLTVRISKPFRAIVELDVRGYVRTDVQFSPTSANFSVIPLHTEKSINVKVTSRSRANWKIVDIRSTSTSLRAEILDSQSTSTGGTATVRITLDERLPLGYLRDQITFVTNDPLRNEIPYMVEGVVQADITVSPATVFLGVVSPGMTVSKQVVVRGTKPFTIHEVQCRDSAAEFVLPKTETGTLPKTMYIVPVRFKVPTDAKTGTPIQTVADIMTSETSVSVVLTGAVSAE